MYRVEITDRARGDADAAHAWMTENISRAFADQWFQGLIQQIETLQHHPARCPVARESDRFSENIHELVYGKGRHKHKYRILYAIRDEVVAVLFVHHTARKEVEP